MSKRYPGTGLAKPKYVALTTQQLNAIPLLQSSQHLPIQLQRHLLEQCRRANLLAQKLRDHGLSPETHEALESYFGGGA